MMQKIYLIGILTSREKHCPASRIDIGLQGWCNDMRLKLGLDLHVFNLNIRCRNTQKAAAKDAIYDIKWRAAA